ncbi:DNA mismatch repair endonuclease MutL [Vaginisenegalia massiliensis]|uniref:DNA mismatch repair endonuclease MutL n=1 Tax=Vaginisenegalia massiliensis TaxID=2058294 RepID=UPI000F51CBEA|nr:DNA mismatch repair endonuclease MutL [Vaginisenegalia massiliensis]
MGKIRQMSEALANQIAAGEVVERPASVVKELVENAIDAQSTQITIDVIEAGIQQIRVTDNGEGMDQDDLVKAFLPHATSKIYDLSDLFQIRSLGFRGEALASIGSVAKVRVESARQDIQTSDLAHFVYIEGSKLVDQGPCASRQGTSIQVDSLFYNTPARLKHLSSLKTELKHILSFVQEVALSYPEIRFTLFSEGQKIFSSVGNGSLRQTIANVYQPAIARQLIQLSAENQEFQVSGFISPPTLTRTNRFYMHWIINGRPVRSYALNEILIKAYGRQLMIGRYPLSVIHVNLDPRLVDVNVHPTKQTVRLSKEAELSQLLIKGVTDAITAINPIPQAYSDNQPVIQNADNLKSVGINSVGSQVEEQNVAEKVSNQMASNQEQSDSVAETLTALPKFKPQVMPLFDQISESQAVAGQPNQAFGHSSVSELNQSEHNAEPLSEGGNQVGTAQRPLPDFDQLRYIGQIHGTYLVAESPTSFYLIDQHAAQERLRYERLMAYDPDVMVQQQLLMPLILNFSSAEMLTIERIKPDLARLGIFLDQFGPNAYQLESYPNWLEADQVESTVRDLTELFEAKQDYTISQIKEKALIMQSCRGAIKANHYLDRQQAQALIQQMKDLEDPYHCPHGRPVFVEFDQKSLEKLFKRIQDSHEGGRNQS